MHPNDEHLLVVRTVEDPDPPALGKPGCRAPKKVMLEFLGARLFEAEDLTAFRIDSGHDVPDRAVLAGPVHPLEDQQQRVPVGRVVEALERAQLGDVVSQELPIALLRRGDGVDTRRPLVEVDLVSGRDPEVLRSDWHPVSFGQVGRGLGQLLMHRVYLRGPPTAPSPSPERLERPRAPALHTGRGLAQRAAASQWARARPGRRPSRRPRARA